MFDLMKTEHQTEQRRLVLIGPTIWQKSIWKFVKPYGLELITVGSSYVEDIRTVVYISERSALQDAIY